MVAYADEMKYLIAFWRTIAWNIEFRLEFLTCGENRMPRSYWRKDRSIKQRWLKHLRIYS